MTCSRSIPILLGALVCAVPAWADETGVTPYRPSVSTPAQLPTPGQLELELGGLASKTEGRRRDSLPYLFKLGFSQQWGVLLGGEAFVSSREEGTRSRGVGDTSVTLKRAFLIQEGTAFGLELTAKAPTAKSSIGSGKSDYTANGIYSQDLGKWHLDANLNATRVGAREAGQGRMQTGLSSALSTQFSETWGAVGELSGTRQRGAPSTAQALAAVTYSPSKQATFDIGAARGLNRASPDWSVFAGVVLPLARLW